MANGIVIRPDAEAANVSALRNAYTSMQALPASDNRGWTYWAGYHGFPHWACWHHSRVGTGPTPFSFDLFLPWHRAYLMYWDMVTRDHDPDAILPWWDWTSDLSGVQGIPGAYAEDDGSNPLHDGPTVDLPNDPARRTRRTPSDPAELGAPLAQEVESVLELSSFEDFSNQLQDIHDRMHPWTGGQDGDMSSVASSAYDPIFWAHHCMIDRLWYLWQLRWGVQTIPPEYLDQPLAPFAYTVSQVLDVRQLGYEYASSSAIAEPEPIDGGEIDEGEPTTDEGQEG